MLKSTVKIAGEYTVQDWLDLKSEIGSNQATDAWQKAVEIFKLRVNSRYLEPIDSIIKAGDGKGEGFSVVALSCMLLEFLAAFYYGKIYVTSDSLVDDFHYKSSSNLYKTFLSKVVPFNKYFSKTQAESFYNYVRCGLLHEARTKHQWVIRNRGRKEIIRRDEDEGLMVVERDSFYNALIQFVDSYTEILITGSEREIRSNFIRKMDDLCEIEE